MREIEIILDGNETDLVLKTPTGKVVGKLTVASAEINSNDFRWVIIRRIPNYANGRAISGDYREDE